MERTDEDLEESGRLGAVEGQVGGEGDTLVDVAEDLDMSASWKSLAQLSVLAALNDAISPLAGLLELIIVSHAVSSSSSSSPGVGLAAYSVVTTLTSFALNVFNFVVVVNMSGVAKAVGGRRWVETSKRVQVAFVAAVIGGCFCSLLLLSLEPALYELYHVEPQVEKEARKFFELRVLSIPFQMLTRTASGILGGFQRIGMVTAANCCLSAALVMSNVLSMHVLHGGLFGCAAGTLIVYAAAGAILSFMVWWFPPHPGVDICLAPFADEFEERLQPLVDESEDSREEEDRASAQRGELEAEGVTGRSRRRSSEMSVGEQSVFTVYEFLRHASNMMIRSFLLSGSLWLMAVVASRLGTSEMAAHGIAVQLWTLISYIVDGFADVGTMVGGKLLGQKATGMVRVVFNRLVSMGLATGVAFSIGFLVLEDAIIRLFVTSPDVVHQLHTLWPLLGGMQVVNSMVFVYDGLIYATHRFDIVRNIMLVGCLIWFCPALFLFDFKFHSLLAIWVVKAVLNAWRAGSAIWVIHVLFYPQWS